MSKPNLAHWLKMALKKLARWLGLVPQPTKPVPPVVVPPAVPDPPTPPEPPKPVALPRIGRDGILFTCDGRPWRYKGVTAFALLAYWLRGVDIVPFLEWAKGAGANLVRVLGNVAWPDLTLDPAAVDGYYAKLPTFARFLNDHRLYCEFTAIGDGEITLPTAEQQRAHVRRAFDALRDSPNVLGEVANEPPYIGVDLGALGSISTPPGMLTASGLYDYNGTAPLGFVREYVTIHPPRDGEWPRKVKDPLYELGRNGYQNTPPTRVPCVNDEPIGAGEVDEPGKRSANVRDFRDHGAVTALFGAGGTAHFGDGLITKIPGPVQQACVKAFFEGMDLIPLEAPTWQYTAGHLGDCPIGQRDELRVYAMLDGNRGIGVIVRKNYAGAPPLRNGWRITRSLTDDDAIVELER